MAPAPSPLRVLHVADRADGGVPRALRSYLRNSPDAIEHHLLVPVPDDATARSWLAAGASTVRRLPSSPIAAMRAIRRTARAVRPDVIHAHSSFPGMYTRIALPGVLRTRLVYTPHGFSFARRDVAEPVNAMFRMAERMLTARGGRIAACSPVEADLARSIGASTVPVIPNVAGVLPGDGRRVPGGTTLRIGTIGRITAAKDPSRFAREVERLRRTGLDVTATWIGDGPEEDVRRLERSGVTVTGWLGDDEVSRRLLEIDVYVQSSAWEGFPLSVLEAHQADTPILTSRIDAFRGVPDSATLEQGIDDLAAAWPDAVARARWIEDNRRAWRAHLAENTPEHQRAALERVYRESAAAPRILVLHWGTKGAGPRLQVGLVRALADRGVWTALSYAENAEISTDLAATGRPSTSVRTYVSARGALLGIPRLVGAAVALRQFIRAERIEAVVSPMLSLWHSSIVWFAVPRAVPYIAAVHDAEAHPGEDGAIMRGLIAADRAQASAIITFSDAVAERLLALGERAPIIRSALPVDEAPPRDDSSPASPPRIGTFGRLHRYKGIDIFADATALLLAEGTEIDPVAVGSGIDEDDPVVTGAPHVEWRLGWIPDDALLETVRGFDVLVLAYREASQSGVLGLAWAAGVPTVVTPVGGLGELAVRSGAAHVAASADPADVAAAIRELVSDDALRARVLERAEAAVASSTWRALSADWLEAVRSAR